MWWHGYTISSSSQLSHREQKQENTWKFWQPASLEFTAGLKQPERTRFSDVGENQFPILVFWTPHSHSHSCLLTQIMNNKPMRERERE